MQPITQNKKRIKVQHIIGTGTAQADIVRNIQLPARARKIVDIHAEIVELDYEIIPNKVILKGALHKQIYYVEEGDFVVKEFTIMREEFTDFVHIQGARPEMEAVLDGHILFVNTNPSNGEFPTDLLSQVAVLAIDVKVIELMTLDVVTDCYGEGLSVQKAPFSVECLIGSADKQSTISMEHTLCKPARKIYDMDAICRDLDYEVLPGRIIVRGILHKQIYYVDACDSSVQAQCFDNDFSVILDVPGAKPDMEVYTKCHMEFCEAKLIGPAPCNMVKVNVILRVFVKVTDFVKMNLVTNVAGAFVDRCRIRIEDIAGRKCHQENVNQTLDVNLPTSTNPLLVKNTKNMTACIRNVNYEKLCNRVIIKGFIHVQVYYVACNCEQELRETSADIPFTTVIPFDCITEDTMIRCRERVEYTDAKIEGCPCETSKIRAIAIIEICVCASQTKDFMVVTNVCSNGPSCNTEQTTPPLDLDLSSNSSTCATNSSEEEICPQGGYTHIVVKGDTLAKIAAAYQERVPGLTWQQIAHWNHLVSPYTLQIDQVLRIPCVSGKG